MNRSMKRIVGNALVTFGTVFTANFAMSSGQTVYSFSVAIIVALAHGLIAAGAELREQGIEPIKPKKTSRLNYMTLI